MPLLPGHLASHGGSRLDRNCRGAGAVVMALLRVRAAGALRSAFIRTAASHVVAGVGEYVAAYSASADERALRRASSAGHGTKIALMRRSVAVMAPMRLRLSALGVRSRSLFRCRFG